MSSSSSSESSDERNDDSSDEFYDAEEPNTGTLLRFSRKALEKPDERPDLSIFSPAEVDSCASDTYFSPGTSLSYVNTTAHDVSKASLSSLSKSQLEELEEDERRRERMEEMRRRLNTEEVEEAPADENSQSDCQTSSAEGLYGAISGRTSHPFKVVDHDALSLQSALSIGRLGRPGAASSNHSTAPNAAASATSLPSQDTTNSTFPAGQTGNMTSNVVGNAQQHQSYIAQPSAPTLSNNISEVVTDSVPSANSIPSAGNIASNNFGRSDSFVLEPDIVASCKDKLV